MSKLKHLQRYITSFEIDYGGFEAQLKSQQISPTFTPTTEEIFETLEKEDIDMTLSHSIIEPIVNRNFDNTFQHKNEPNQRKYTHKNTSKQNQHINTSQQYQNRNTSKQYQHRNNSQKYQDISFKMPRTSALVLAIRAAPSMTSGLACYVLYLD